MRPSSLATCGLVLVLASSDRAQADVVHLEDGGRVEGEARREAGEVVVFVDGGQLRFPASLVARIEATQTPLAELRARRARLRDGALKPRLELAAWALRRQLVAEARSLYREVLRLDPHNRTARRSLERDDPTANVVASSADAEPTLEELVAERRVREAEAEVRAARRAALDAERRARVAEQAAARANDELRSWPVTWGFGPFPGRGGRVPFPYPNTSRGLSPGLRARLAWPGAQVYVSARPGRSGSGRGCR